MRVALEIAHTTLASETPPSRPEFARSCELGHRVREALEARGHEVDVALLVDDKRLGADEPNADQVETLLGWASELTIVERWASERRLGLYRSELLGLLRSRTVQDDRATDLDRYVARTGHLPCSASIAIWHLLRLGAIGDEHGVMQPVSSAAAAFRAEVAVAVLPAYVEDHERTADRAYLRHVDDRLPTLVHRLYAPAEGLPRWASSKADPLPFLARLEAAAEAAPPRRAIELVT